MQEPIHRALKGPSLVCVCLALLAGLATVGQAQQSFPFTNDFTSTGFTNVTSTLWTLDTVNGVLNYNQPGGGGVVIGTASEQIAGVASTDFVMSTRFTLNDIQGAGTPISVAFGLFSSAPEFIATGGNSYYLADWALGGGATGNVRIVRLVDGSPNATLSTGNAGLGVVGETYELRLAATHGGGGLELSMAVFDDMGVQLGTSATAVEATPLSGENFGLRFRTAHASHILNADVHDFQMTAPPAGPQADFDADSDVDGADFLIWQQGLGSAGGIGQGDADGDGMITGMDLDIWKSEFGLTPATVTAAPVPEPSALALMLGAICLVARVARNRRASLA